MKHILDELKALEERARKLQNQNLADVAASAHGKVLQLSGHPDLELLGEKKDQTAQPNEAAAGYPNAPFPQSGDPSTQPPQAPVTGL